MMLTQYLRAVSERKILVLVATAAGVLLALVYTWTQTPTYKANIQLFVSIRASSADDLAQLNQGGVFTQQRVRSYADIVNSTLVTKAVVDSLQLPYTPDALSRNITAATPLNTVLLDITVTDTSPERARAIADEVARQLPMIVDAIEGPPGNAGKPTVSPVKLTVTRWADVPSTPASPRRTLNVALGLFMGFSLGAGTALLRDTFDRTIRSTKVAAEVAGVPVLGAIADEPKLNSKLMIDELPSARAEEFRQLRTSIRFLSVDRQLRSFVVTGSLPDEGKTTTAANLAISLAQSGQPVVLIDADLRVPGVADAFALSNAFGLTSVLLGDVPVNNALQHWRPDLPLYILAAGPKPPNPSELLGSARLKNIIESLQASGMIVVFDSPPLLPVTDAAIIAQATDGAVVVTRVGRTRTDQLASAIETLRSVNATVLGVVANRVKRPKETTYSKYHASPTSRRARAKV
ncbi:polysaccharide biosynthesis tyrosine autokinase [Micromonospora sp. ATA32]|nr:polysaccharide biosynthesis tyrosine autokinase [Micromonospora sp. ATA32]